MRVTNFEFYKDVILKINDTYDRVAVKNGKPVSCNGTDCSQCELSEHPTGMDCQMKLIEWLYAEHIEQPKLTKRERAFCEAVQMGWIARDCEMHLFWFNKRPRLEDGFWYTTVDNYIRLYGLENDFGFIKDIDAEPMEVADLLKLEVEEHGN